MDAEEIARELDGYAFYLSHGLEKPMESIPCIPNWMREFVEIAPLVIEPNGYDIQSGPKHKIRIGSGTWSLPLWEKDFRPMVLALLSSLNTPFHITESLRTLVRRKESDPGFYAECTISFLHWELGNPQATFAGGREDGNRETATTLALGVAVSKALAFHVRKKAAGGKSTAAA